jgi:HEAT repeat protein
VAEQVAESRSWWQTRKPGSTAELGLVRIDRVDSTQDWQGLSPEQVGARRGEFYQLTESLAAGFGAMQPVMWEGDGAMLFVGSAPTSAADEDAARQAGLLGIELHQRLLMSGFRVRIGVHCGRVAWAEDPGKLASPEIDRAGHLERDCPDGAVTLSEDVYLSLAPELRQKCAYLGITRRDGTVAFIYPAGAVSRRDSEKFLPPVDDHESERHRFLRYVESADIRRLRYVGLRLHRREPPSLELFDVFTPLDVEERRPSRLDRDAVTLERGRQKARDGEMHDAPWFHYEGAGTPRAFRSVFDTQRHIVVLGAPGAGKSTLLRWLALSAAAGRVACRQRLGVDDRLLPLLVPVGRLWELRESLGKGGPAPSVVDAMAHYFHERNAIEDIPAGAAFLRQRLDGGECLVLLDGLDEVPTARRQEVARWIESFAAAYRGNRVVVTSREVGFVGLELPGGMTVTISPFNDRQVREYVITWYRAYRAWEANLSAADAARDQPIADAESRRLLEVLKRDPRLRSLSGNPFLLSALALVHRAEGQLPTHRVQLYDLFARALCETWEQARKLTMSDFSGAARIDYESEAIPVLGRLALWLHEHTAGVAPEAEVKLQITQALVEEMGAAPDKAARAADEFLQRASRDLQIIAERGPGEYGFLHLTFQEFFAAQYLHARERFESAAQAHWIDPRWEEIILLGVGTLSILQKRTAAAGRFISGLLTWKAPGAPWVTDVLQKQVVVAAKCCADAPNLEPSVAQEVLDAFVPLTCRATGLPLERGRRALARIRGSRFAVGLADRLLSALRDDKDDMVRANAAFALGELCEPRALEPLLDTLRDDKSQLLRFVSADALGALGDAGALELLVTTLRSDKEWLARAVTARALGTLGDVRALEPLADALRVDNNVSVRLRAADALASLRDARALEPLRAALREDKELSVGRAAALGLGTLWKQLDDLPLLVREAREHNQEWVTLSVLGALANVLRRDEDFERVRSYLRGAKDVLMRAGAAAALGKIGDSGALTLLLAALREDKEPTVRANAAQALGMLADPIAFEPLLAALCEDKDGAVRASAGGALGALGDLRAVEPLLAALREDKEGTVRASAAGALGTLGDPRAVEPLLAALRRDKEKAVRASAAGALGTLGDERAVDPLLVTLRKDKEQPVRTRALEALWELSDRLPQSRSAAAATPRRPSSIGKPRSKTSRRRQGKSGSSRRE